MKYYNLQPIFGLEIDHLHEQRYLISHYCPYRSNVKRQQKSKRHGNASQSTCTMCNWGGFTKKRRRKESLQREIKNYKYKSVNISVFLDLFECQ